MGGRWRGEAGGRAPSDRDPSRGHGLPRAGRGWRLLGQGWGGGGGEVGAGRLTPVSLRGSGALALFKAALLSLNRHVFLAPRVPRPYSSPRGRCRQPRLPDTPAHSYHGRACSRLSVSVCAPVCLEGPLREEGSVYPVCKLVLTPPELLAPPPPSLIASLVLIEGLSHASALAVWSELPPPGRDKLCPSPSRPSTSPQPWNCPPRTSPLPGHLPASLWFWTK